MVLVSIEDLVRKGCITLQTGPFGSQLHSYDYLPVGVPVVSTEGIQAGRLDHSVLPHISEAKAKELSRHRLQENDILFARRGVQATGRTARVRQHEVGFICGTGAIRARIQSQQSVLDPHFFGWFLAAPKTVTWIREQAIGATMPNLNEGIIKRIQLPLLPIKEQREIAAILGALDDKIELNRKMAVTLEEMAQALYLSWFVDFDPVWAKSEGRTPGHMDEATAALFPDSFGDDGLPMGWDIIPLSSLCVQVKDSIDPRNHTDQTFDHYSLPAFDTGNGPVRELGSAIQSQKLVIPFEAILFSRLNPTTPRIWWARTSDQVFASVASTEFLVAVARVKGNMPFLYSLLVSEEFRSDVISRVTGTSNSHQRVKPASVLDIETLGATAEIRAAYGEITAPWFDRINKAARESRTLATLRDSLVPKLMSGELRMSEAQELVEAVA